MNLLSILFSLILIIASLPFVLYLLFIIRRSYLRRPGRRCIPLRGPRTLPFLGNIIDFSYVRGNSLPLFERWIASYGNTFVFSVLGEKELVFINDPINIKHVLSTKFREGVYGKGSYQRAQYFDLIGDGIFNSNPPLWVEQRKCAAGLFGRRSMKGHAKVFRKHAGRLVKEWERMIDAADTATIASPFAVASSSVANHASAASIPLSSSSSSSVASPSTIDIQDYFLRFTLDSFSELGFGTSLTSLTSIVEPFSRAFDFVQSRCFNRIDFGEFWVWLLPASDKRFQSELKVMDDLVAKCIAEARSKSREQLEMKQRSKPDLLSQMMLEMTDSSGVPNSSYDVCTLRDTVMNFLMAGRDTTALMLSWFFYQLSQNPHVEQKIIAEIARARKEQLNDENSEEEYDDTDDDDIVDAHLNVDSVHPPLTFHSLLHRLPYLHASLQESLRLYPSVPFNGFTALKDDVLPSGHFVRAGTYVTYSAYLLHRREELYADAATFNPDRFLDYGSADKDESKHGDHTNGSSSVRNNNVSSPSSASSSSSLPPLPTLVAPRPYTFLSFHGGPRACPGMEMAYIESKVAVASILDRFTLRRPNDVDATGKSKSKPVQVKRAITLTARGGMHMIITKRESTNNNNDKQTQHIGDANKEQHDGAADDEDEWHITTTATTAINGIVASSSISA